MTYRLPSLNSLRAFEAAARNLGFEAAARELGVTAGAVSQQVRKLEHSLGVPLFHRLSNGLRMTDEGETYFPRITKVFDDLTAATEEIAPDINGKKFSVGVCPRSAAVLPSGWPFGEWRLEPYVRERVFTSDPERVVSGALDCLLSADPPPLGDLEAFEVSVRMTGPSSQETALYLIHRQSAANCAQIKALLDSLRAFGQATQ